MRLGRNLHEADLTDPSRASSERAKAGTASGHAHHAIEGFSIIELLIIVCLVMIIAAIAIPTTRSAMATYQLDAAVDSVTGAIQSARYQAIMHGYPYQVDFNSANQQIQVSSEPPPATTFSAVAAAVPISGSAITLGVGTPSSSSARRGDFELAHRGHDRQPVVFGGRLQ